MLYKDDPTIMIVELMNEMRCVGTNRDNKYLLDLIYPRYPLDPACNTKTITDWADDMSTFIKSIDKNHLVGCGDEGFFANTFSYDSYSNVYDGTSGVDFIANAKLKNVDVIGFHVYFGSIIFNFRLLGIIF